MTFHPTDPDAYPGAGTKVGPAWRALLALTEPGDWLPQIQAMQAMEAAGPIIRTTAVNLIYDGVRHGFLQRRHIKGTKKPREYEIRRTPTWP